MAAVNALSSLAQTGAVFNDVTRQLEDLSRNVAEMEGQGPDSSAAVVADLPTVMDEVNRGRKAA